MYLNKRLFPDGVPACILPEKNLIAFFAEVNGVSSFYSELSSNRDVICLTLGTSAFSHMAAACAVFPPGYDDLEIETVRLEKFPVGLFDARKLMSEQIVDLPVPEKLSQYSGIIVPDGIGATSRYLKILGSEKDNDKIARSYLEQVLSPFIFLDKAKMSIVAGSRQRITLCENDINDAMMFSESKKQAYSSIFGSGVCPVRQFRR